MYGGQLQEREKGNNKERNKTNKRNRQRLKGIQKREWEKSDYIKEKFIKERCR